MFGSIGALLFPLIGSIPLLPVSFVLFFSAAAVAVGAALSVIIEGHSGTFLGPASEYIELLCKVEASKNHAFCGMI